MCCYQSLDLDYPHGSDIYIATGYTNMGITSQNMSQTPNLLNEWMPGATNGNEEQTMTDLLKL